MTHTCPECKKIDIEYIGIEKQCGDYYDNFRCLHCGYVWDEKVKDAWEDER